MRIRLHVLAVSYSCIYRICVHHRESKIPPANIVRYLGCMSRHSYFTIDKNSTVLDHRVQSGIDLTCSGQHTCIHM